MRLLLDTHIFLWFISADARLPAKWRDAIRDTENEVFLGVVSIWEAIVKYTLGKLPLPHPPEHYLPTQRVQHQIRACRLMKPVLTSPHSSRDIATRLTAC